MNNQWYTTDLSRIIFDHHMPEMPGKNIAAQFNPKDFADTMKKSAVDSVVLWVKCQFGNFYMDMQTGHKHCGLGDRDFIRPTTALLHEYGIRALGYYSVSWDEMQAKLHPDWIVRGPDGEIDTPEFRWSTLCIHSPYREVVKTHIKEICTTTALDGLWIDMTIIGADRCHCIHCKSAFQKRYGLDLPHDKSSPNWNLFQQWRFDTIEEFYAELRSLAKAVREDIVLTNNYWGYPYMSCSMGSRAIGAFTSADYVTGEAYTDWSGLSAPGIFSKYLRGVANGRPVETIVSRFHTVWDFTVKSDNQIAYEIFSAAANGAIATIDDSPYHTGALEPDAYIGVGKAFSELKRRKQYLAGAKQIKYCAIFVSQSTKEQLHNYGDESFVSPFAGAYKLFNDLHYPIDFVFDENLSDEAIKDFAVLILPDAGSMSSENCDILKRYVKEGGMLISVGEASLYDETGVKRDDFALCEVFGAEYEAESEFSISFMKIEKRPFLVENRSVLIKAREGSDVRAVFVEPLLETDIGKKIFYHNHLPSPDVITNYPSFVVNQYGGGTSAYFAADIFSQYGHKMQSEFRNIIKDIIHENAVRQPGVCVENCPMSADVVANMVGNRLIVHILNPHFEMSVCTGHMDSNGGNYKRTLEMMEDIVPIYDVRILAEGKFLRARTAEAGEELTVNYENEKSAVIVPKVNIWESVEFSS